MSLEEVILLNSISLDEVNLDEVSYLNIYHKGNTIGDIAEQLVYQRLDKCKVDFFENLPYKKNGLLWTQHASHSVNLYKKGQFRVKNGKNKGKVKEVKNLIHEYDFLLKYQYNPYVVEVKSKKIGHYAKKISRAFKYADILFEGKSSMLLFFPFENYATSYIKDFEYRYPRVKCVDIGYKLAELDGFMDKFYINKGINRSKIICS